MSKAKILIVEDDRVINSFLTTILNSNNYTTINASNGTDAITMASSHGPDLILLDLGLPDIDGLEVLKSVREWSETPIIIVSARDGEREKVTALDSGANDYVTKPFGNGELLARIRAALRQQAKLQGGAPVSGGVFRSGGLGIDYVHRRVSIDGNPVHLTPIEYKIIVLLSKYAGKVLTHDYMLKEIWGPFGSDSQTLRVNVANIRRKIEANPADPQYILTEVGVGYRMADYEHCE